MFASELLIQRSRTMDDAPTKWKGGAVCLAHLAIAVAKAGGGRVEQPSTEGDQSEGPYWLRIGDGMFAKWLQGLTRYLRALKAYPVANSRRSSDASGPRCRKWLRIWRITFAVAGGCGCVQEGDWASAGPPHDSNSARASLFIDHPQQLPEAPQSAESCRASLGRHAELGA